MEQSNSNRYINILIIIAGLFCCIAAGFIPAPEGILGDGRLTLIESQQMVQLIPFFVLPSVLMLAAGILVILGKMNALALIASIGGTMLYAVLDAGLGLGHQAYAGVLMNMFGAIMMLAGTALQSFATDDGPAVVSRKAAKKRSSKNPKEFRYERKKAPKYDDIYVDAATTAAVAQALDLAELEAAAQPEDEQAEELIEAEVAAIEAAISSIDRAKGLGNNAAILTVNENFESNVDAENLVASGAPDDDEIASLRAAIGLNESNDSNSETPEPVQSMSADELIAMLMEEESAPSNRGNASDNDIESVLLGEDSNTEDFNWVSPASADTDGVVHFQTDGDGNAIESVLVSTEMPPVQGAIDAAHKAMADALETPNQTMTDFYSGIEEIFLDYDGRS